MFIYDIVRWESIPKEFNLYVLRSHYQVRAKIKLLGRSFYMHRSTAGNELLERKTTTYKVNDKVNKQIPVKLDENRGCPETIETEAPNIEKYKILLDMMNPNLRELYRKIKEVCPEFHHKRLYHLYWKNSESGILPIVNHITYLSMMALIGRHNDNLYLVAREWGDSWNDNVVETYVPLPEDRILVDMVAPKMSVFTAVQELQMDVVNSAARTEYTRTYSPPMREVAKGRKNSPGVTGKGQKKSMSPKPKKGK